MRVSSPTPVDNESERFVRGACTRALDGTLWLRRVHSVGHKRQHLNLLTDALTVNSLSLWRHQARHGDPPLPFTA